MRTSATKCLCVRTGSAQTQRDRTNAPACRASWPPPSHTNASRRSQSLGLGRQETEYVGVPASLPIFPPGLDSKPPTVMLKRPVSFPYIPHAHILTHVHIENTHLHSAQDALYPPHTHSRGPGIVQWMYYMGFSILQISICLKGILWTFLFSKPRQFDMQIYIYFHFIFSITFSFCVLFISFTWRASAN